MVRVFTPGKMVENMRVSTSMIRSMDTVFIPGLMAVNMMGLGHMVNSMEEEDMSFRMPLLDRGSGRMERE